MYHDIHINKQYNRVPLERPLEIKTNLAINGKDSNSVSCLQERLKIIHIYP